MPNEIELYQRRLARESSARRQAEAIIEQKSLGLYREAQDRKLAEEALRDSEERYRLLVESSPNAILVASAGQLVFANNAALRLYGARSNTELLDQPMLTLVASEHWAGAAAALRELQRDGNSRTAEEQAVRLDGSTVDVSVTRTLFSYQGKPGVQIVVQDISERKRLETKLRHQASHDSLTALPNRELFSDRLGQAVAYARRHQGRFMVCFLDLDRFKWINDSLGHKAGDEVLRVIASRIAGCVRESDTVARIGGDEFLLLLHSPGDHKAAMEVVSRVVSAVVEPMALGAQEVSVSCSIGCSRFPEDAQNADTLMRYADAAMYRAKEAGDNKVYLYNDRLRHQVEERIRLDAELRHAIERDELHLHYQAQVDLNSGAITGLEALLRWKHSTMGDISPARFIPIAEESGLISSIGEWVLHRACAQNKAWQDAALPPVPVAVNVSASQLRSANFYRLIEGCLSETGLAPGYLEIELTESVSMAEPEKTIPLMNRLKALGVSMAIDDFGTGYSNMTYLKRLPADRIKVDGSFVREITSDTSSLVIAEAVISMAHQLGMKAIAEMVETEEQLVMLAARGCDEVQGYYFSRPLAAEQCAQLLAAGKMELPQALHRHREPPALLVLDDEPHVTAAIQRVLRHIPYEVLVAHDVEGGFAILACRAVGAVLCDQRLPKSSGVEFLVQVRQRYPRVIRLMLTAYPEFEVASEAINLAAVHRFLTKPWDDTELRTTLVDALETYEQSFRTEPWR